MPPRCYGTAAAKMPKRAGYSALNDKRAVRMVRVRARASENVLCKSWTGNQCGRLLHSRAKLRKNVVSKSCGRNQLQSTVATRTYEGGVKERHELVDTYKSACANVYAHNAISDAGTFVRRQ
jgi:hypothetical protein